MRIADPAHPPVASARASLVDFSRGCWSGRPVEPRNPFAAHVTLCEVSHTSEIFFVVLGMLSVVFAVFACIDPAPVKIPKEFLPALPALC
jgi:hypothetical protein